MAESIYTGRLIKIDSQLAMAIRNNVKTIIEKTVISYLSLINAATQAKEISNPML